MPSIAVQHAWSNFRAPHHDIDPPAFDSFEAGWNARKRAELAHGYSAANDNETLPFELTRLMIRDLLSNPFSYTPAPQWSAQGFGMLRTYFGPPDDPKRYRLNVWHSLLAVPNVSTVHDHPWHFRSWVIAGRLSNVLYHDTAIDYGNGLKKSAGPYNFHYQTIKTGEGGGPTGEVESVHLRADPPRLYEAGETYRQDAKEIHRTYYDNGTVTLNERTRVGDGEHARVFWPYGTSWVDAQPRPVSATSVSMVCKSALRLFKE